jgi:3-oxo-5alpha-steroid 4-dehydrogenase
VCSSDLYWAINLAMKSLFSFMLFFTLGGVRVDEQTGEALRGDGSRIPGLYAAGRAAVGICANTYACSGLSLADGVFSGRRAGRHCAAANNLNEMEESPSCRTPTAIASTS